MRQTLTLDKFRPWYLAHPVALSGILTNLELPREWQDTLAQALPYLLRQAALALKQFSND